MNYGKHQSFYLKKNWLNKALNALEKDELFFNNPNNFRKLGLGKNMFQALNYWIKATKIVDDKNQLTEFGNYLLKYDRGCHSKFSLNMIHFNLVSSRTNADNRNQSFYWFFNVFQEPYFTKEILLEKLIEWSYGEEGKKVSENTLKRDVDCIISTYHYKRPEHPEDKNISLLGCLNGIMQDHKIYFKNGIDETMISKSAFLYIIHVMSKDKAYISIDDLLELEDGVGKVFSLNRNSIIELIEELSIAGYPISLTRTNGLDTVQISTNLSAEKYFTKVINKELEGDVYEV